MKEIKTRWPAYTYIRIIMKRIAKIVENKRNKAEISDLRLKIHSGVLYTYSIVYIEI